MGPRVEQGNAQMLVGLQQLLQMMEQAGGAPDLEARHALLRLTTQLEKLEAATIRTSTAGPDNVSEVEEAVVEAQVRSLQVRLGSLESRLGAMTLGAQELLADVAGGFLQELQPVGTHVDTNEGSQDDIAHDVPVLAGSTITAEAPTSSAVADNDNPRPQNHADTHKNDVP